MPAPAIIYMTPGNTKVIQIFGLQDLVSQNFLNSATLQATLYDQQSNPDPVLNNISLEYVAASEGNYQGIVPGTFNPGGQGPVAGLLSGYTLKISGSQAGVTCDFEIPVQIAPRRQ